MNARGDQCSTKTVHWGVVGEEKRGLTQPMGFKTGFLVEVTPELRAESFKVNGIGLREERGCEQGILAEGRT